MNRTKIYSCLVRRSFREFPCKFLGHTVSPFWRSRSFVVWKRVAHHEKSCDQNRYSVEQENQARSAKFEKKRNCDVLFQYNIVSRVTYEKYANLR